MNPKRVGLKSNNTHQIYSKRSVLAFLTVILFSLSVAGCGLFSSTEPTPTPTPVVIIVEVTSKPTSTNTSTADEAAVSTPTVEPEPTATPLPEDTPSPTVPPPPPAPTSPPCGPPAGWVVYVVQPGDNLFRLATNTQTTVAQVKQANCLVGDTVYVGQGLYLPFIPVPPTVPPPPPTPVPPTPVPPTPVPPTPEEPECNNDFCPNPDLDGTLTLEPSMPDQADFVPCESVTDPRIEFDTTRRTVELGQRRYFYICVDNPVSASIARENGQTLQVTLLDVIPNPDLKMGSAQAVVDWPVLPFEPTGAHTMTVTRSDGPPVNFKFRVDPPTTERILAIPPAGPPGTVFQVYYTNFDLNTTPTFDFYGEDEPSTGGMHEMSLRSQWQITIDQPLSDPSGKGWAQAPLVSETHNSLGAYSITFDNKRVFNLFWLQ